MDSAKTTGLSFEGLPTTLLAEWALSAADALALGVHSARRYSIYGVKRAEPLRDYPDAWRAEYLVIEQRANGTQLEHHLAQRKGRGVLWVTAQDANRCASADMVKPPAIPCLTTKPRWKREEALIPERADGGLYTFLKQLYVPISARVREHFMCGFTLFLFATPQGGEGEGDALTLALFTQDMSEQTAEDHYRLEEQMASFEAAPRDLERVQALIRAGDKHFHAFVLESPRSTPEVLAVLLQHAKTQTLQSAVQKRLTELSSKVNSL